MAKLDLKSAFTICPVKKSQWVLLACQWLGKYFVFPVLPFGLRSAPHIFNSLADLLNWIFNKHGCDSFHYLDDYFMAHLGLLISQDFLRKATALCEEMGIPLAPDKVEGPKEVIKYLGIIIDTNFMETRLPVDKLQKINNILIHG